jgi:class 3 adenylate cyclase/CHASE2 domain-containing sensor protein
MKARSIHWTPGLIAGVIITLVCLLQALPRLPGLSSLSFSQRIEWMIYDWRMRLASQYAFPLATNMGAVLIDDDSITAVQDGDWGTGNFHYGLYWPRHIYGKVLRELRHQGAKAVAFDILFSDSRPDHLPIKENNQTIGSDAFFARELGRSTNTILAARSEFAPLELFLTNASAIGDVSTRPDGDGVLRRAKAIQSYRLWHPAIRRAARFNKLKLSSARLSKEGLVLRNAGSNTNVVLPCPVDSQGAFELAQFRDNLKRYWEIEFEDDYWQAFPAREKVYIDKKVWNLGIQLAAFDLNLDLDRARIETNHGRIVIPGPHQTEKIIPIDPDGCLLLDWSVTVANDELVKAALEDLLTRDVARQFAEPEMTNALAKGDLFAHRLVLVGSTATGSDMNDLVATPLGEKTFGLSQHCNVANMILTGRFIRPCSHAGELLLIILMGSLSAAITWHLRVVWASFLIFTFMVAYFVMSAVVFVRYRFWLPVTLPLFGAMLLTHLGLITQRVIFEQQERRRIKSVFSKVVSPDIVNELLSVETLSLGGARRKITVYFADVRGFTEFTDKYQAAAEEYIRERKLTPEAAERHFDAQAVELLQTVSVYLGLGADIVKKHGGILDKYIGDSVMAFWGAPMPNREAALCCVRAAIEVQRAIRALNQQRQVENQRREAENTRNSAAAPQSLLPLLSLGTGINTGEVIVGLMGSDAHGLNYTVLGREVNVASRLEGLSGHGHIIISESTHRELVRDDPSLAASCRELEAVLVKGIRKPVRIYEVPW